jgi:DNA-cytosine methyltransferase
MNVLSLFDGISAGQVALERADITVDNYYASEIDKYAIQVTQKNYPNTIQLGSVTDLKGDDLPQIDLLIGGSPCQGFSFAGKQLNFDDPRSALFFEYVRLLKEVKPKYFLLENVAMKQEYQDVISEALGVKQIVINSSLVSAQNRKRLYWTNIPNVTQPEDRGVVLRDIIEDGGNLKSYFEKNRRQLVFTDKVIVVRNIYPKNGQNGNIYSLDGKSKTLSAGVGITGNGIGSSNAPKIECDNDKGWRKLTVSECEMLQTMPVGYTSCISNTQAYKCLGNGWTVDVIAHIFGGL